MYEKRIEIRWRDLDAYGHVNNAVFLTYLEEARDAWLGEILGADGGLVDYVVARVAIDFRRELKQADGTVTIRNRIARLGRTSLTLREEIVRPDGDIAAEAETVLVMRDRATGRPRPLTAPERTALEKATRP